MKALRFLPLLALVPALALADDDKKPPVQPDRPDFTDSATITPKGLPLLEVGFRYTLSGPHGILREFGDQPLFRIGLNDKFELRVGPGAYGVITDTGFHDQGREDGTAGFKYKFHDGKDKSGFRDPSIALEVSTNVPTGDKLFKEKALQPLFQGIVDVNFSDKDDLGLNLVFALPRTNGQQFTQWGLTASHSHQLTDRLSVYGEIYGLFPEIRRGRNATFGDAGFAYLLNNDVMLDAFAGTRLSSGDRTTFFGFGVSLRF